MIRLLSKYYYSDAQPETMTSLIEVLTVFLPQVIVHCWSLLIVDWLHWIKVLRGAFILEKREIIEIILRNFLNI